MTSHTSPHDAIYHGQAWALHVCSSHEVFLRIIVCLCTINHQGEPKLIPQCQNIESINSVPAIYNTGSPAIGGIQIRFGEHIDSIGAGVNNWGSHDANIRLDIPAPNIFLGE